MDIPKKMEDLMNKQINEELYSEYIYLAMSAYFEDKNLPGMAHWMREQAKEEHIHAMKFFDFINERRGRVVLDTIKQPPKEYKTPLAAFEEAFKHEQFISDKIDKLMDLAISLKDHASAQMLQWFVEEQVEEEASADKVVQQLKLTKENPNALMMLDKALGYRGKK